MMKALVLIARRFGPGCWSCRLSSANENGLASSSISVLIVVLATLGMMIMVSANDLMSALYRPWRTAIARRFTYVAAIKPATTCTGV